MNVKKFIELAEKGEISFKNLTTKEMTQLTEFFDIYVDGDEKKVILR